MSAPLYISHIYPSLLPSFQAPMFASHQSFDSISHELEKPNPNMGLCPNAQEAWVYVSTISRFGLISRFKWTLNFETSWTLQIFVVPLQNLWYHHKICSLTTDGGHGPLFLVTLLHSVNCLLTFEGFFFDGWIVCSTLRVFFILGLNFVNFIPGLNNLCSHHRTCGMGHWWLTTCELSAQLWDFCWWLNCLLNFEIFIDGWIVCSTLRVFLFWPQILFLASMVCVPIREHGSHLWIACSTLWFSLVAELFAQLWDFCWWLNCLLNFEIFVGGWIVCSTLRVFLFWPQILFLASVSPSESMGHTCELLAQLCDSHWWLNCLLNFEIFIDGWIVCSTLRVFFILASNFIPGLNDLGPHQRAWVTSVSCLLNFASFFNFWPQLWD